MPALQVKDFPDDLYEELRECAVEECRSVSQQTIYVLREFLHYRKIYGSMRNALWAAPLVADLLGDAEEAKRASRLTRRKRIMERIEARGTLEIPDGFANPAEMIRQMRQERTDQILEATGDFGIIQNEGAPHDRS